MPQLKRRSPTLRTTARQYASSTAFAYFGAVVNDSGANATFFNANVSVTTNSVGVITNPSSRDNMGIHINYIKVEIRSSRVYVSGGGDTQGVAFSTGGWGEVRDTTVEIANVAGGVATQSSGGPGSRITDSTVRILNCIRPTNVTAIGGGTYVGLHTEASIQNCPDNIRPTVTGPCFGCLVDGVYQ